MNVSTFVQKISPIYSRGKKLKFGRLKGDHLNKGKTRNPDNFVQGSEIGDGMFFCKLLKKANPVLDEVES
jgi:hypothetical protein